MEHRRRRVQGAQPSEELLAQETAQEPEAAGQEKEMNTSQPEQTDAPRRRRRAQADQAAAPAHAVGANEGGIPRLPREDVRTEEETAEESKRTAAVQKAESPREKRTYTSRIPHKDLKEAQRKAAGKAKKMGRAVRKGGKPILEGAVSVLMSLSLFVSLGISKLGGLASGLRRSMPSRVSEEGHAPEKTEAVELEAIRPEDYHGRAHHRNDRKTPRHGGSFTPGRVTRKRAGAGMRFDMQQLLSLVFAGVAVVSAFMIASILWRTVRTNATNKKVAELYAQSADTTPAPDATPEFIVFMPENDAQDEADEPAVSLGEEALLLENDVPDDGLEADISAEPSPEAPEAPEETEPVSAQATIAPMGKRIYHHVGGDALPQMAALHKENRDIVGWLKIENVLDLPVVYRDNSYYLKRDFYKQKNTAGTIFLDVNHPFKAKTQNLLLHGHNMKDGTMFGRLLQYETDLNYVRWHPFVRFDTLWRKEEYVIFAVLRVSLDVRSENFFNYFSFPTFVSDEQFMSYIRQLQLRSIYAIPVDVEPTDALLTMSTCLEDDRLVIVARRVREGETHTELRQVTNLTTRQ